MYGLRLSLKSSPLYVYFRFGFFGKENPGVAESSRVSYRLNRPRVYRRLFDFRPWYPVCVEEPVVNLRKPCQGLSPFTV